ncbi:TIGR02757 family protein [bacterium]|nr:TIGR02757 family protein [bacterium]
MHDLKPLLEKLYLKLNKRALVNPDPLWFLYDYPDIKDREITGLIASSLAYGRVAQILKSIDKILLPIEGKPFDFVTSHSENDFLKIYKGFVHRFTTDEDLAKLFRGMKHVLKEYGNFENLYLCGVEKFVDEMNLSQKSYLIPSPADGSACKRLNLFFRWMVRNDEVDPGGWTKDDKSRLIVPLDTHAFHIAKIFGFTERKAADLKTAVEITSHYAEYAPDDPVKYDFALTRFGIRPDMSINELIEEVAKL